MKIEVNHSSKNFNSFRAQKVKSLFNAENGHEWKHTAELPVEDNDWQIGLIVGASGSGKTSIGRQIWPNLAIHDLYSGWDNSLPIVENIAPQMALNEVTAALSAVGLGDVPTWLRPFGALSNGEQYRAGLARLICDAPDKVVIDEFTSVVDRQIAQIGAAAFAKSWKRNDNKQIVLLSCHYDIVEWLQPDWVYDTRTGEVKKVQKRPPIKLDIWKTNGSYWKYFKEHYYLDLPHPPAAEYFVGTVNGELVAHLAVCPLFTAKAYRATRLVVMPEWQGAGVGTAFLNEVMQYHLDGNGRCGHKYYTFFHTSHPQLCGYLRHSKLWNQTAAKLHGDNKIRSQKSILKTGKKQGIKGCGYGGHFRAVQAFKYLGK
ncbi:GNAT family N-acetyltransferase [Flavobacterium oreochromis]|uniref:GNAT family N-acetyltransferase n=1 Tax=Flavobacterium oreochromis TaxID=2906078 RepID=UPI001CE6C3F5|nr:GNAT family N-acetyltransferase [Flavobacterium oreochromis]QYS86294.1 GNAT family N-acetyltransferase [Flavobacterium oreochromis]